MTVTIASTTDTEEQVASLVEEANLPPTDEASSATVEVAHRYRQPEVVAEEAATQETLQEVGVDTEEPAPDVIADEASDDAASPEEVETAPADKGTDEEKPKKRRRRGRSYKDRASQLAREKALEKSRADSLQSELDQIRAAAKTVVPPKAEATPPAPEPRATERSDTVEVAPRYRQPEVSPDVADPPSAGRPNQDDFETYEQFQEALVDWKVNLRLTERDTVERERIERDQQQRAQEQIVAAHTARIDTFRSAHDDFDVVIEKGKDLPMTRPMQDSVLNSDMGPAVMYHLCRFPEECDRIAAMAPMAAIREMGKLEARIEAAGTGPVSSATSMTRAPRPIKPVGGGATASTVPLDQMDFQSYKRARENGAGR
tara:strand:- start:1170 stop:2288 length:1119 start_codon:yes stop_codon:yes gene_type:complete